MHPSKSMQTSTSKQLVFKVKSKGNNFLFIIFILFYSDMEDALGNKCAYSNYCSKIVLEVIIFFVHNIINIRDNSVKNGTSGLFIIYYNKLNNCLTIIISILYYFILSPFCFHTVRNYYW